MIAWAKIKDLEDQVRNLRGVINRARVNLNLKVCERKGCDNLRIQGHVCPECGYDRHYEELED